MSIKKFINIISIDQSSAELLKTAEEAKTEEQENNNTSEEQSETKTEAKGNNESITFVQNQILVDQSLINVQRIDAKELKIDENQSVKRAIKAYKASKPPVDIIAMYNARKAQKNRNKAFRESISKAQIDNKNLSNVPKKRGLEKFLGE